LNNWWLVIDSELSPGITVAPTAGLETSEAGGTASFEVVLDSQPTADITIAVSSSNTAEGTVNLSSLTFTPANWDQPQTVVATGVDDALEDGDVAYSIITGAALSTDPDYDGLDPADVAIINLDDDTNYAPVAVDDDVTADQDMAAVIDALANDSDPEGAALTSVSVGQPTSGSVVLNADQTLTYTPNTGFSGTDSFTYQISDGDKTDQATVTITVRDNTIAPMFVGQIFLESRKGGRYRAVFVVHDEFNQPLEGVQIQVSFAGQTYSGVTDSQGEFKTDWNKLNAGDSYFADVLDLALAGFDWNDLEDDDEVWLTA
ncbi:MAG: Ig-like domain-containing protein, partial [bacterium]|nr:Ig-like domain-containing protein [bacterium]